MKTLAIAAATAAVLACSTARAGEVSFEAPVQVGTYRVAFTPDAGKLRERFERGALAAQADPRLAFEGLIYVVPRPIKGDATAAAVQLPSGAVAVLVDPRRFGKLDARGQDMVLAHELVHVRLLVMGLGDADRCAQSAHEAIAYTVSAKMERDFDRAAATRAHITKLLDYVRGSCGDRDFAGFFAAFEVQP